jgi:hypothetical protein
LPHGTEAVCTRFPRARAGTDTDSANRAGHPAGNATLSIAMPYLPGLAGYSFHVAFMVLDPLAPQRVRTFSQAKTLTVR